MSSPSNGKLSWILPLDMNSYNGKLMFAAIISLLLVISFVLLLHAYARWVFLIRESARHRRRTALSSSTTITTRFRHHLNGEEEETDGLEGSVIRSIPIFVHKRDDCERCILECVICLSVFEEGEVGKHLPNCGHAFHVECIDRWLGSHSSCPICRAVVGWKKTVELKLVVSANEAAGRDSLEIVVDQEAPLEVEVEMAGRESISSSECNGQKDQLALVAPPASPPPPPPPPRPVQLAVGCSLKRILSRAENKVFPSSSSNTNELNV